MQRDKIRRVKLLTTILCVFLASVHIFLRIFPKDGSVRGKDDGYLLEPCNCTKHLHRSKAPSSELKSSLCSDESDWIGPGQKVLSYTLHKKIVQKSEDDNFQVFFEGIQLNVRQVKTFYKGWVMRLYSDLDLNQNFCEYACLDEVTWCDVRQPRLNQLHQKNFRVWRFMPIADPLVHVFVSRDLDSSIIEREKEAVDEWEASSKIFHLTRDSGIHHGRAMLAGMWGAKTHLLGNLEGVRLLNAILESSSNDTRYGTDEDLLEKLIFEKYPENILAHDSYTCNKYKIPSVPFPKQRQNMTTHVAMRTRMMGEFVVEPCPIQCRPVYGKNWTFC